MKASLQREGTGSNYTRATRSNCVCVWAKSGVCVIFTASGWTIPFKSCLHTLKKIPKKKEEQKKKKIIPFRQNLLGSIRPFLEPIQFLVLGASLSYGKPPKRGRINQRRDSNKKIEPGKARFCFWLPARRVSLRASSSVAQRRSDRRELFSPQPVTKNHWYCGFHLWYEMKFSSYTS